MRAIDGDALFREMEKAQWYNNADRDENAEELVLNAPTIEPRCEACEAFNKTRLLIPQPQRTGRWIPCSERLPENKSYVLTTIYIPGRQPHARSGWFEDGLFMNDNGDTWKSTDREVCAWMPLPDPYHKQGGTV